MLVALGWAIMITFLLVFISTAASVAGALAGPVIIISVIAFIVYQEKKNA